ncbi:TTC1 [Branchiostoma lanceolatum]|uniref:Tetratricopeptide repeat protein 1 n=1 Tax=Branchiostoma lanceolatum TaxID=7740 RepID=A0A8K0ENM3_BRALA|nr:TTC1 [Branchiostoma lanceolatum]
MTTKEDISSDSDHDEFEDAVEEIHTTSSHRPSNNCQKTSLEEGKCQVEDDSKSSEHLYDTKGESEATQKLLDTGSVKNDDVTEPLTGEVISVGNQEMIRSDETDESCFHGTTTVLTGQPGKVIQCSEDNHCEVRNSEDVIGKKTLDGVEKSRTETDDSQKKEMTTNKGEEENVSSPVADERDDAEDSEEMEELKRDDEINTKPFAQLSERLNERETEAWEQLEDGAAAVEEGEEKEDEVFVDEEYKKEMEKDLTEEEKEERRLEAADLKAQGNEHFKKGDFTTAMQTYTQALVLCPLCYEQDRAIMYSNRAACRVKMEENEMAVEDCSKALELQPDYVRALLRRAQTYEVLEKLDEALTDYQRVVELDRSCHAARAACMRLPDEIKERNEKMKAEMMDKLKDLGNMVLRPFGLSTANFRVDQNQDSGSYNIQFVQNPNNNDE